MTQFLPNLDTGLGSQRWYGGWTIQPFPSCSAIISGDDSGISGGGSRPIYRAFREMVVSTRSSFLGTILTLQLWLAEYSQSNSSNPSAISSLVLESQAYPTIPDVAVSGHSNFSLYGICKLNWAQLPYHPQFLPDDSRSHQTPCLGAWAQSSDHFEKSQFEIFSGLPMPSSTDFRGFSLLNISLRLTSGCKNKK